MSHLSSVAGCDEGAVIVAAAKRDMEKRNKNESEEQKYEGHKDSRRAYLKLMTRVDEEGAEKDYIESDMFAPTGKKIGQGAWGGVYIYTDAGSQEWGIKKLQLSELAEEQLRKRGWTIDDVIRNERVPLDAAYHHVVPRIVERDKNGVAYIAMPLHEEGDLSDRLYDLGINGAIKVAENISDALSYVHSMKEIRTGEKPKQRSHRDVKPKNILLKDGEFYLTDFGSCSNISIRTDENPNYPAHEENYLAPECLDGKFKTTLQTDIWSLGAVFYEMISKHGIYDGLTEGNKRNQPHISARIEENIPRAFRKFLEKSLAVDPNERYANGSEMKKGIEKAIKKYEKTSFSSRAKRWGLTAVATAVIAGALAGFNHFQNTTGSLEQKITKTTAEAEHQRKMANVRSFLGKEGREVFGKDFYYFSETMGGEQQIKGWLSIFKDKKAGIAAYLDTEEVFASMMDAGLEPNNTSFDYKTIEPFLEKRNSFAYWEVWSLDNNYIDNWRRTGWAMYEKKCAEEWGGVKKLYQQEKLEAEIAKQKEIAREKQRKETDEIAMRIK